MKKIISVFLSVIMLVTSLCFAVSANASVNKNSGEYDYTFVSADKIAIKEYTGSESTVNIPSKIDGFTVTEISGAFCNGQSQKGCNPVDCYNNQRKL